MCKVNCLLAINITAWEKGKCRMHFFSSTLSVETAALAYTHTPKLPTDIKRTLGSAPAVCGNFL